MSKLHYLGHLQRHPFLGFAYIGTVGGSLSAEGVNFTLMLNKLLRSNICDRFLFEVTNICGSLQLFLKMTLMNLIDEELLNIEFDVFRDVQVIKRSIRLDRQMSMYSKIFLASRRCGISDPVASALRLAAARTYSILASSVATKLAKSSNSSSSSEI